MARKEHKCPFVPFPKTFSISPTSFLSDSETSGDCPRQLRVQPKIFPLIPPSSVFATKNRRNRRGEISVLHSRLEFRDLAFSCLLLSFVANTIFRNVCAGSSGQVRTPRRGVPTVASATFEHSIIRLFENSFPGRADCPQSAVSFEHSIILSAAVELAGC